MWYKLTADLLVLIHFSFIIFVVLGGLLVFRWPAVAWVHVPAASWGAWIEITHGLCPLTTIEQNFRSAANAVNYEGSFIDNYIIPIVYPTGFTPEAARLLGLILMTLTLLIYSIAVFLHLRRRAAQSA